MPSSSAPRTALVTGASSGIGAATAQSLARLGTQVALVARRADRLDELAARIRADGGKALTVAADITERAEAVRAVQETVDAFGRLDSLVNNAGVMLLGPIHDAPVEEWDRMIAINVQGLLYVTHAALPHLLSAVTDERGTADIINVSSEAGRVASANFGVYNLTKHGIGAFSESLRQELVGRGVRVSLIEPGPVATELFGHIRPEILKGWTSGSQPLLRAEDVADTIVFVATRPAHVAVDELLVRPGGVR